MNKKKHDNKLVIYQTKSGALELRGDLEKETVWATQAQMAQMFNVSPQNITLHLRNIYKDKELDIDSTCKESLQVQTEGKVPLSGVLILCAGRDSNLRRLMPADLQSALVDRLSTDAFFMLLQRLFASEV